MAFKTRGTATAEKFLNDVKNFQTGFSSMLDVGFTTEGTREIQELFGEKIFPFAKPLSLLKTLIRQGASGGKDIILDFFAGSCPTAQAVLELNQEDGSQYRFIMVQLPEPCDHNDPPHGRNRPRHRRPRRLAIETSLNSIRYCKI